MTILLAFEINLLNCPICTGNSIIMIFPIGGDAENTSAVCYQSPIFHHGSSMKYAYVRILIKRISACNNSSSVRRSGVIF